MVLKGTHDPIIWSIEISPDEKTSVYMIDKILDSIAAFDNRRRTIVRSSRGDKTYFG